MISFDKPKNYDETQANDGEFTPINLGGHSLTIKKLEECQCSDGRKYFKVLFDTSDDDFQPRFYTKQWQNDTRKEKKWGGTTTLFPTDKEGNTSKTFKQFCTCIEKTNNSKIQWGAGFEQSIVGKYIGGIFGEEEYISQSGEIKVARKLFYWCSGDKIVDAKIPEKRYVERPQADSNGFISIPQGIDDELPFK